MTKFCLFVPAVALGLAVATPAVAQENSFEGARAEALVGFDHVGIKDFGMSGLGLGGLVGYDWQDGNIVYGFEGEVDGNVYAQEQAILRQAGAIRGNITAPRVILEDGSRFKGSIDMEAKEGSSSRHGSERTDRPQSVDRQQAAHPAVSNSRTPTGVDAAMGVAA